MSDIPLDQKAREVAVWLGWQMPPQELITTHGAPMLTTTEINLLHAACLRERRLREALANLVRINEEHNEATKKVIQVSPFWKDDYLDEARNALKEIDHA